MIKKTYNKNIIFKKNNKNKLASAVVQINWIKIHSVYNVKPKTDLDRKLSKNFLRDRLMMLP